MCADRYNQRPANKYIYLYEKNWKQQKVEQEMNEWSVHLNI